MASLRRLQSEKAHLVRENRSTGVQRGAVCFDVLQKEKRKTTKLHYTEHIRGREKEFKRAIGRQGGREGEGGTKRESFFF